MAGALLLLIGFGKNVALETLPFQLLHQKNGSAPEAFGSSIAGVGDVNGDGKADFVVGNPLANPDGFSKVGAIYVYSGADGDLLYQVDGVSPEGGFGYSVAQTGDLDGDSKSDLIVGAPYTSPNAKFQAGSVFILSGSNGSTMLQKDGAAQLDYFGTSVAGAGDVNNDGKTDFMVGATGTDVGGHPNAGSVFVYSGTDGSPLFRKDGSSMSEFFGTSVAGTGDVDGDGYADFVIGTPYAEDPDSAQSFNSGAAFVYSGRDGSLLFNFQSDKEDDNLGYSVSGAGDVNGDGRSDFVVGVPHINNIGPSDVGRAIIYSGGDGSALWILHGDAVGDYFGTSVAGTGDVDGDGKGDVAVGAFGAENGGQFQAGAAFVFSGADGALLFRLNGARAYDRMGVPVAGAGDVNADGYADFIISAPQADTGRGQVFVYGLVPTDAPDEIANRPARFELAQNYPNPFNPATTIRYRLPRQERVALEIFNLLGERVNLLADGLQAAGEYAFSWNGTDKKGKTLPSGIYFYRLRGRDFSETKKMLLLK
ncbi:MAG: FG-GAP-like repeat-containing protein [candidate division Zixibacteria bacterium]|nr:FG-GAP-like repeat-containing protein [candidate division Zixibacteria bacterium]